jgi:hypothetical protein
MLCRIEIGRKKSGPDVRACGGRVNAKKAKALRKLINKKYSDPRIAEYVYRETKKYIKGGK